jgi:hypothetical protein
MWMMTNASAEEALKRYVMSSSPAPCIMNYGRKHGEERERGISRILRVLYTQYYISYEAVY